MNVKTIVKSFLAVFAAYISLEAAVVATDVVRRGEIEAHREILQEIALETYAKKHRLFYGLLQPHPRLGFTLSRDHYVQSGQDLMQIYADDCTFLVKVDSLGFRGEDDDKKIAPIVVLGSTAAFGGLFSGDSFSERLEEKLEVEVSNFSLFNYKPWQFNAVMREFPDHFSNRTILYVLTPYDFIDALPFDPKKYYAQKGWEKYHSSHPPQQEHDLTENSFPQLSFFDRTLTKLLYDMFFTSKPYELGFKEFMEREGHVVTEAMTLDNRLTPAEIDPVYLQRVLETFDQAISYAYDLHSKIMFVLLPSKGMLDPKKTNSYLPDAKQKLALEAAVYQETLNYVATRSVESIDLTIPLQQAANLGVKVYETFNLTRHGHEYVAETLARDLTKVFK